MVDDRTSDVPFCKVGVHAVLTRCQATSSTAPDDEAPGEPGTESIGCMTSSGVRRAKSGR